MLCRICAFGISTNHKTKRHYEDRQGHHRFRLFLRCGDLCLFAVRPVPYQLPSDTYRRNSRTLIPLIHYPIDSFRYADNADADFFPHKKQNFKACILRYHLAVFVIYGDRKNSLGRTLDHRRNRRTASQRTSGLRVPFTVFCSLQKKLNNDAFRQKELPKLRYG